jgi:hypothetical protein
LPDSYDLGKRFIILSVNAANGKKGKMGEKEYSVLRRSRQPRAGEDKGRSVLEKEKIERKIK